MAGRGSRLRPHTLTVPKPLIPIAGKPIVHRLVEDIAGVINQDIEENIYRFYIDIKNRKTGRSKFINQLSEVLEKKILEEENESK